MLVTEALAHLSSYALVSGSTKGRNRFGSLKYPEQMRKPGDVPGPAIELEELPRERLIRRERRQYPEILGLRSRSMGLRYCRRNLSQQQQLLWRVSLLKTSNICKDQAGLAPLFTNADAKFAASCRPSS